MVTKPVVLKAMVRVCADLPRWTPNRKRAASTRWREKRCPLGRAGGHFRNEGFYERFPAKGQVERVARIHRELSRWRV